MRGARGRVDANQAEVVRDLRKMGATVQMLSDVGAGCPDLLVGWRGQNWLFEIKNPKQEPRKRKLTAPEATWHTAWRGQVATISTAQQAMSVMICGCKEILPVDTVGDAQCSHEGKIGALQVRCCLEMGHTGDHVMEVPSVALVGCNAERGRP